MAINYEARVLSALLKRGDFVSIMGEPLDPLMETYGDTWQFIKKYYQNNREMPPPSVVMDMFDDFEYDEGIEGATKHHIEILKKIATKTKTEQLLTLSSRDLSAGKFDPVKIVERLSQRLSEIQRDMGISRAVDVRDFDNALTHYDRIRELSAQHDGQPGIPFGFSYMDKAYPTGMAPGHFIVVMGYSGKGKTWFTIKLLVNAWLKGYSPMLINLEMSPEELRDRIYFLISQYSMTDLMRADIDPDDFRRWAEDFMKGKAEFTLVGNDTFGDFSIDMVHSKVEQYKPDIVALDYMGLFIDREFSQNETVRMKNLSRQIKQLATAAKIPILAISAVTGKDKKDRVNPPEIAQLSWSGQIEYDANLCIAVHTHIDPVTQRAKKTEIVCRKNRNGPMFDFFVNMDLENGVIEEIDEEEQAELMSGSDELDFLDED